MNFAEDYDPTRTTDASRFEEPSFNTVKLNNNVFSNISNNHRTKEEWLSIVPSSAFFHGVDPILKDVIIMVYEDPDSNKISTVLFSCFGEICFNSLTLDNKSRFYVACENLKENHRKSNVRRALAITLLKTYSSIDHDLISKISNGLGDGADEWDETIAGDMASNMELVKGLTPANIGEKLISLGFLQPHYIESTVLDVIYEDDPEIIELNNKLVYLLGEQVEQLFDPLTEYSPEDQIQLYEPPQILKNEDDGLSKSICNELLQFQENQTQILINFLQNFVIPLRVKVLNGEFGSLTIEKFNQILPPTIDEITRMNCILLEALQKAIEYGSFEIVKACGMTIPHFYKAYMRHESAFKCFSHHLKTFCREYALEIQPKFSERKIETIMNSSINLTKFKLILERLINIKNWTSEEENAVVNVHYKNSVETIDSFAKDHLKQYSKRVFTPSGKVLTEICDGVPSTLTYGWLNRKVVSVFDAKNLVDNKEDVIVLFNDYVIFASVDHDTIDKNPIKPNVSDIIMNSLMNEKPMKNIPNLKIRNWSTISDFEVTTFERNNLKVIFKKNQSDTLVYSVENSTKFLNLLNKAKILNKSTPFHLFKSLGLGFTIFSTAHERNVYGKEISKSPVALFLNVEVDQELLQSYNLFAAISATFIEDDTIGIQNLDISGELAKYTINSSEFSSFIPEILSALELQRHNHKNQEFLKLIIDSNNFLLKATIGSSPGNVRKISSSSQPVSRRSSVALSVSSTRKTSVNYNKPLPRINDSTKKESPKPKKSDSSLKKKNLKKRLSQIFSSKKSKKSEVPKEKASVESITPMVNTQVKQGTQVFTPRHTKVTNFSDDEDESEDNTNTSLEDCITFESSMTPVFDDNDDHLEDLPTAESLRQGYRSENWLLSRDNSSRNFSLRVTSVGSQSSKKEKEKDEIARAQISELQAPNSYLARPYQSPKASNSHTSSLHSSPCIPSPNTTNSNIPSSPDHISEKPILGTAIAEPLLKPIQRPVAKHFSLSEKDRPSKILSSNQSVDNYSKPRSLNPKTLSENNQPHPLSRADPQTNYGQESPISSKIPTFSSLDDDFNVNILKVGYDSLEDLHADNNEEDVFYTPKSLAGEFPNFESEDDDLNPFRYISSDPRLQNDGVVLSNAFENVQTNPLTEEITFGTKLQPEEPRSPSLTSHLDTESTENFELNSLVWASPSQLNSRLFEDAHGMNIVNDESFGYLAGILDNSCIINEGLKESETYKTLPRSFSSIKYLGAYINDDTPMSKELFEFLDE